MANLNPKRTKRCNQSLLVGTLTWTTSRHLPSRYAAFGSILKPTTPRHQPSRDTAFGRVLKRTTVRHRHSPDVALGETLGYDNICFFTRSLERLNKNSEHHYYFSVALGVTE